MTYDEWLTPPEYSDPIESRADDCIELSLKDIPIRVNEDMSWDYLDESWAEPEEDAKDVWTTVGGLRTYDYKNDIIEHVDDLIVTYIPGDPGQYKLSCDITLGYDVETETYGHDYDDGEGGSFEVDDESSEVMWDFDESKVDNCSITPSEQHISNSIQSATSIGAKPSFKIFASHINHKVEPLGPSRSRGFFLHTEWDNDDDEQEKRVAFYDGTNNDYYYAAYSPLIQLWEFKKDAHGDAEETLPQDATIEDVRHTLCELNENFAASGDPVTE